MRRLRQQDRDDSGVVTLLVIGTIPLLLLAAALAIDVNRFSQENSSAQHSADATALAVATDCVISGSPLSAASYADYRKPGQAISGETPVACGSGQVRIRIEKDVNGGLVLDRNARQVNKEATVIWGTPNSATTAPVVISQCTFDSATANGTTFPSAEVVIPLGSGGATCPGRPPGAFGWLDPTPLDSNPDPCLVPNTLNASGQLIVQGNPGTGNNNPWNCITAAGVGGRLTIPIYAAACRNEAPCAANQNDGVGNNNWYLIVGFAEIEITGWDLQHGSPKKAGAVPNCPKPASNSCISGRFINFALQLGSTGPATDFGVKVIYLSK
jgi:Flp pilus assembly protein TadG